MAISLRHAIEGLAHAVRAERNLKIFAVVYVLLLFTALLLEMRPMEWLDLLLVGGLFFSIELLNTAIERLVDAVDAHAKESLGHANYTALKATKDVAASASLVCLVMTVAVVAIVFWPYVASIVPVNQWSP